MKTLEATEMFPNQLYSHTAEGCYSFQREKQHV